MCPYTCPMESGTCWVRQVVEDLDEKQRGLVTVLSLPPCGAVPDL